MEDNEHKISKLIYKSISKTLSKEEEVVLEKWLSIPINRKLYERIINSDNILQKITTYKSVDIEKAYSKIEDHINTKPKIRFLNVLRYAAIFIGVIIATYIYRENVGTSATNKLEIVNTKILLQIDDTTTKVVNEEGAEEFKDKDGNIFGVQNGKKLVYKEQNTHDKIVFNTLSVPYGKKFELVLSDGTKVHLNAGTSLKYPSKFVEGVNREVFLKGEAFFDVAHDKKHPFIVNSGELDVQVLGTKFNITAYPDEVDTDVVLVEGSVQLDVQKKPTDIFVKPTLLKPGYKGSLGKNTSKISLQKVNPSLYTSWIYGELIFRDKTFGQIIKKLEKNYNVSIKNKNISLNKEVFNASFKNESIENILVYFNETHKINYQIINNEIIIQ